MTERKTFSIEQSEELIAQLKTETSSEFEQLRKTLKLLAQVPELSQGMVPPVLPSTSGRSASVNPLNTRRSHRTIITSIISAGILASASLTAAAVTGKGPAPIVAVANKTVKFVKEVVGAVTSVVAGNDSSAPHDQTNTTPQSEVQSDAPTSSDENGVESGNDLETTKAPTISEPQNSIKENEKSPVEKITEVPTENDDIPTSLDTEIEKTD